MNHGKYRHRITFQTATETTDGQGGVTVAMTTLATQWANVTPLSGDRLLRMQQIVMGQWYEITTNYRADLSASLAAGNGIVYDGRTLNVRAYQNVGDENMTWKFLAYEKR